MSLLSGVSLLSLVALACCETISFQGGDLSYISTLGLNNNNNLNHNHRPSVLLLHGARFTSQTWLSLGTLSSLSSNGFPSVAIDIPGFGSSDKVTMDDDYVSLLVQQLQSQNLLSSKVVCVSPSMSGAFSIPVLFNHPETFQGFVAVAPVGTQRYSKTQWQNLTLPLLIVYGETDAGIGIPGLAYLEQTPNHDVRTLSVALDLYWPLSQLFLSSLETSLETSEISRLTLLFISMS